jgi:hypothetical protein
MLPQTRLSPISLALVAALFASCEDVIETEFSELDNQQVTQVVSREQMTVRTVANAKVTSECVVIDPYSTNDELYLICVPENWNGELILYAHGYVAVSEPGLTFAEGEELAPLATTLGFAFATTTFSANGLHIQQGIDEILLLRDYAVGYLEDNYVAPSYTYLAGGSQGGAITTLTLERNPGAFSGGFSLCGPCGNFKKQLNHYGDFRLLFDYYFEDIIEQGLSAFGLPYPDGLDNIPGALIANWENIYIPVILQALQANPQRTQKLMAVSKAPFDSADPATTIAATVIATLWYNFFTIDDAKEKIQGVVFDNTKRIYFGTGSFWEDWKLNKEIERTVLQSNGGSFPLGSYETSGEIDDPLVMMHTTKDPIQLFWHQPLYRLKVLAAGNSFNFAAIPIDRYGHCNFTDGEIVLGLSRLIFKVKAQELLIAKSLLNGDLSGDQLIVSVIKKAID